MVVCHSSTGRVQESWRVRSPLALCWDTAGHLLVLSSHNTITVHTITGEILTSVKLRNNYNGLTVIGKCVLLLETYCVTKLIWKQKPVRRP